MTKTLAICERAQQSMPDDDPKQTGVAAKPRGRPSRKKKEAAGSAAVVPPEGPESEPQREFKKSTEQPRSLLYRVTRLLLSWAVLLAIAAVLDFTSTEFTKAKPKLVIANKAVLRTLDKMQPISLALTFYDRAFERHGFALYQWSEPLNASVPLDNLQNKLLSTYTDVGIIEDPDGKTINQNAVYFGAEDEKTYVVPLWEAAADDHVVAFKKAEANALTSAPIKPAPDTGYIVAPPGESAYRPIPITGTNTLSKRIATAQEYESAVVNLPYYREPVYEPRPWSDNETSEAIAFAATFTKEAKQYKRYALPGTGSPDSSQWTILVNTVLALPDAYMGLVQFAIPKGSRIVQLSIVLLIFLLFQYIWVRMNERQDVEPGFLILMLLMMPLFVSLTAFVLLKTAVGTAHIFGNWLVAPAFTVTATAGIAPFLSWAVGIITEHHATEKSIKLAARLLLKEAEEKAGGE